MFAVSIDGGAEMSDPLIWISKVKRESEEFRLMLEACRKALAEGRAFRVVDVYCQIIGSATEFHIEQPQADTGR